MVLGSWQLNTVVTVLFLSASLALAHRFDKDRFSDPGYDRSVLLDGDRQVTRELKWNAKEPDNLEDNRWENNWRRTGREDVTRDRLLRAEWHSERSSVSEPRIAVDEPSTKRLDNSMMTREDRAVRENDRTDESRNLDSQRRIEREGARKGWRDMVNRDLELQRTEPRLNERQRLNCVDCENLGRERLERSVPNHTERRAEERLSNPIRNTMQSHNNRRGREERNSFPSDRQQERRERDSDRDVRSDRDRREDASRRVSRENGDRLECSAENRDSRVRDVLPEIRTQRRERDSDRISTQRREEESRIDFTDSQRTVDRRETGQNDRRDDSLERTQDEEGNRRRFTEMRDVQERRHREPSSDRQLDPSREINGNWRDDRNQQSERTLARRTASHEDRIRSDGRKMADRRERSMDRLSNERDDDRREDVGRTIEQGSRKGLDETAERREARNREDNRKDESEFPSYQRRENVIRDEERRDDSGERETQKDVRRQVSSERRARISREFDQENRSSDYLIREDSRERLESREQADDEEQRNSRRCTSGRSQYLMERQIREDGINRVQERLDRSQEYSDRDRVNYRRQSSRNMRERYARSENVEDRREESRAGLERHHDSRLDAHEARERNDKRQNSRRQEERTRIDRSERNHIIGLENLETFQERSEKPTSHEDFVAYKGERFETERLNEPRERLETFRDLNDESRQKRREGSIRRGDWSQRVTINQRQVDGELRQKSIRDFQEDTISRKPLSERREQFANSLRRENGERSSERRERLFVGSPDDAQTFDSYGKLSIMTVIQGILLAFIVIKTLNVNNSKLRNRVFLKTMQATGSIRS